jgi:transposase
MNAKKKLNYEYLLKFNMKNQTFSKIDLYKIIKNNQNKSRSELVQHFVSLGFVKSTVYRWLKKIEVEKSLERKKGSGRPVRVATKHNIQKIARFFNHKSGCSQNRAARKFNCTQQNISTILKKHTDIRCYKKTKKPLMTPTQKAAARPKCRKLLEKYQDLDFVLDDESYFTLSNSDLPGNDRYYSSDKNVTPEEVKHRLETKFEPKLLVWVCDRGLLGLIERQSV